MAAIYGYETAAARLDPLGDEILEEVTYISLCKGHTQHLHPAK